MTQFENVNELIEQSSSTFEESIDSEEEDQTNTAEFVDLLNHSDYEILTVHPFTIRRKDNHYQVSEWNNKGYPVVTLNRKNYLKHRLIALQFIDNPDNLPYIDHINRDKTDYHIENLRFVSSSTNNKNKSSHLNVTYEFVKEISDEAIKVLDYGNHRFDDGDYYFHDDVFYFFNGIEYRIMHINEDKKGLKYVCLMNTNNKKIKVCYSKFKRLYNLM